MMRAPVVPNKSYIFEMNDTLGMYSQSNATKYVDIRVLQNYDTEVWELKYRIELLVAEIGRNMEGCDDYWNVDVVSVDGGMLLKDVSMISGRLICGKALAPQPNSKKLSKDVEVQLLIKMHESKRTGGTRGVPTECLHKLFH